MNAHRAYWPLDDAPLKDGDSGFVGVDERLDPDLLPPGMVASATNCRFRNGRVEPRPGITILPWMKADGRTPFTTTGALHVFKVSPPAAYPQYVGTGSGDPYLVPDGTANAVFGLRFGEVVTLQSVKVDHDFPVAYSDAWSTDAAVFGTFACGVLVNGVVANPAITANVNLTGQEFQVAVGIGDPPFSNVLQSHSLRFRVTTATSTHTAYLTFPP